MVNMSFVWVAADLLMSVLSVLARELLPLMSFGCCCFSSCPCRCCHDCQLAILVRVVAVAVFFRVAVDIASISVSRLPGDDSWG